MNKLIFVFTAVAFMAGACAQTDSTKKTNASDNYSMNQDRDQNNNQNRDQNNNRDLNSNRDQNNNQNRELNNNQNQDMQNNSNVRQPDGYIMKNGKMMVVRNGQLTVLDRDMTLTNGTKIMGDGTYTDKNGNKKTIKEGQQLDLSGILIPQEANKDQNIYLVPDTTR